MTDLLRPLTGYLPASEFGTRIVGPPRSTLSEDQIESAADDPLSFRHAAGRRAKSTRKEALEWLRFCLEQEALVPMGPAVVVYRQARDGFVATGMIGDLSLKSYALGRVKRHEKTIAKTERKMAKYMRKTRMYGNPPVTACRVSVGFTAAMEAETTRRADAGFTTIDGIHHELWIVEGSAAVDLCAHVNSDLYITDGHHRLAAASLVASREERDDARLPVGVFPESEFRLRSFARCVSDPGLKAKAVISRLNGEFELEEVGQPGDARPTGRHEFGVRIGKRGFRLRIPGDRIPDDHYASLDTNLLQKLILAPVFGIENPRSDKRLSFFADLAGGEPVELEADVWLLPYPVTVGDVMTVADSNRTMPAKSTWFAPKLPSGLVIRPLD